MRTAPRVQQDPDTFELLSDRVNIDARDRVPAIARGEVSRELHEGFDAMGKALVEAMNRGQPPALASTAASRSSCTSSRP